MGVSYSAMSNVSTNGGKYGQRWSTLNTRCKPRNGGMLSSNALSPVALVMVLEPCQSHLIFQWVLISHSFNKWN